MCDRHVRAWRNGSREGGWDERDEIRGLAEKDAKVYVCGSWTVAKEARKKWRMEWQGGCCGVEEAENWLEESKGPTIWQTFCLVQVCTVFAITDCQCRRPAAQVIEAVVSRYECNPRALYQSQT